ncbi:MAG TPA: WD40 repeat domain-containing protein, partial [Streptosporangiaceae bacterium]|nr:WD40 repeat domain-containing protein [Streptosporangiaceae bacterium]
MSADSDLLSAVPVGPDGRDWPATAPGLLARITEQTADAGPGIFATLVNEPGFLAAADPATLGPLLWATGPQAYDAVRAYRRARPLLGGDVNANAAYLAEATRALTGAHLAAGAGVRPLYRTHLAAARRDDTLFTLSGHNGMVGAVAFGTARGDGEAGEGRLLLASCSDDRTVRLWDPLTGMSVGGPLTGHSGDVYWVAADNAPDGRLILASGGLDRTVQLWDASTGVPIGEPLTGHTGAVYMLAFATVKRDTEAGGGRWLLASASEDTTLRIWDPLTGMPIGEPLTGHNDVVWSVTFATAPDGVPFLVSASWDGTVRFWDPLTQSQSGDPLEEPGVRVVAPATSPDGRFLLATGNIDGAARVWDLSSRTLVSGPLASHSHHVGAVAFATTPDGQFLLATTAHDDPVRLWDPLTGTPVGEPLTPRWGYGYALSFGTVKGDGEAGGQRLLLASHSG